MIYILSSKISAALKRSLGLDKKKAWIESVTQLPNGFKAKDSDQIYLDISGLSPATLKKTSGQLKKNGAFWGVIDPKGAAVDPAAFFFNGASDYIGQALLKKGLTKKRFSEALSRKEKAITGTKKTERKITATVSSADLNKKNIKLPSVKFDGWKSIRSGTPGFFFFLFVSLSGKTNLRAMLGEASLITLKNQLREILQQNFAAADALLWMETEGNNLLLVPPTATSGKAALEAALKVILNSRLICIEKLGLSLPLQFTCAIHYGQTTFQAPGKTGAVISAPVNYIFHLGSKKAEAGRLTISGDIPDEAIPPGLLELLSPAGIFEGIPIRQSKRFVFK